MNVMESVVVKSERVILRELVEEDWRGVHEYASQQKVCQYQPWGPNSVQQTRDFVAQVLEDANEPQRSRFVFAVILAASGAMIGAGEMNVREFTNREGEISYVIHPNYWQQGYATEVAETLLDFGYHKLQLHRIYATCDPRNIASAKVLEKVGMIKEGVLRQDMLLRDGWRDSCLYSVLEQEWLSKA